MAKHKLDKNRWRDRIVLQMTILPGDSTKPASTRTMYLEVDPHMPSHGITEERLPKREKRPVDFFDSIVNPDHNDVKLTIHGRSLEGMKIDTLIIEQIPEEEK